MEFSLKTIVGFAIAIGIAVILGILITSYVGGAEGQLKSLIKL